VIFGIHLASVLIALLGLMLVISRELDRFRAGRLYF
jgi:hypothetical protein